MAEIGGQGAQRVSNSFFNFTMLTGWTNIQREMAAMVGYESFRAEISKAGKLKREGKTNTRAFQTSLRYLERYGLTGAGADYDFLGGSAMTVDLNHTNPQAKKAIQLGIMRFANETLFMPNPNDIPQWAQTPWGSVVAQLKSYPLMMSRLAGYAINEAGKGNVKPISYMLTAGVGMGAIALSAKDIVQSRGGEDQRSNDLRDRRLTTMFPGLAEAIGVSETDATDEVVGWYLQSMMAMGGLGLFGDFFFQAAEQADNGAYGQVRMMSYVLGPSAGLIPAANDIAGGVGEAAFGGDSPGKIRQAARTIAGRVPIFGGLAPFREGSADFIGGPKGDGKKTGGFSGGGFK